MAVRKKTQTQEQINKSAAVDQLWRNGVLYWKLDSCQKNLYKVFKDSNYRKVVWKCSRRLGKSYALLIIAIEYAIRNPETQIKYACPTALMAQKLILPTIKKILADCPHDLRPNYVKSEKCFYFNNDSVLQIEGTDQGNAEKLRGTESHLSILDEAGFMDDLEYVINDILLPQALTTDGKLIISSTPPKKPGHAYNKFVAEAQMNTAFIKKTILDAMAEIANDPPHFKNRLNPRIVEEIKLSVGGEMSSTWRREFMCEDIIMDERQVVPEFTDKVQENVVREWPRPQAFDSYTAMDLGFVDYTAILYAYYDFRNNKLVIEDEAWLNGKDVTTKNIAEICKTKETALWTDPNNKVYKEPYLRVSDDDLITINDLYRLHQLKFVPTRKDERETAINEVRMKMAAEQIIINPRCKNLIFQLKTATWTKNRKTFERSEDAGHYDLVAALIYLVRNVHYHKNPYPFDFIRKFDVFDKHSQVVNEATQAFKSIFGLKNK